MYGDALQFQHSITYAYHHIHACCYCDANILPSLRLCEVEEQL